MIVNTIQLSKWRKLKDTDIELIDIAVKTGIEAFAPTWEMVALLKRGLLTEIEYTNRYRDLMLRSYVINSVTWSDLLKKDKVAIACYCSPDAFCHRHLLVNYIQKICSAKNIPFRYLGEIQ